MVWNWKLAPVLGITAAVSCFPHIPKPQIPDFLISGHGLFLAGMETADTANLGCPGACGGPDV